MNKEYHDYFQLRGKKTAQPNIGVFYVKAKREINTLSSLPSLKNNNKKKKLVTFLDIHFTYNFLFYSNSLTTEN